jgi:hypothetical protein
MLRRNYSLILAAIWLAVAVCFAWPEILSDRVRGHLKGVGGGLVGFLAFLLAIYNVVRWWAVQSLHRHRAERARVNPLSVRKVEPEPEKYEPNPELNFIKIPDDGPKPE